MGNLRQIRVGDHKVGMHDLDEVFAEAQASGQQGEQLAALLLRLAEKNNYIPGPAREQYAAALLAEYRRSQGLPVEDSGGPLEIKVLGRGCSQCEGLSRKVMEIAARESLAVDVEHITDLKSIAAYGAFGSPALVVGGKVVWVGSVPPENRIVTWLKQGR